MPRVNVEWLSTRTSAQRQSLAKLITKAVVDVTACRPDQVTVVFHEIDPAYQAKGGVFWSELLAQSKESKA
ncbi:MAG: tautomerase family protein [Rhizomicrobium sp.]